MAFDSGSDGGYGGSDGGYGGGYGGSLSDSGWGYGGSQVPDSNYGSFDNGILSNMEAQSSVQNFALSVFVNFAYDVAKYTIGQVDNLVQNGDNTGVLLDGTVDAMGNASPGMTSSAGDR